MPPKLDKSHGFMQSIIKNQILRDEYHKEQTLNAATKASKMRSDMVSSGTDTSEEEQKVSKSTTKEESKRTRRTPRRAAAQLYVPPHAKSKERGEGTEPSQNNSPEVVKRLGGEMSTEKKHTCKRSRRSVASTRDSAQVLFKFEYEDDAGGIRTFHVKEDDNPEDLAEIFGNQLGLTKSLKKALHYKLSQEINSCLHKS